VKAAGMEVTDVLEKGKERLESEFCKDHNANRMANVICDLEEERRIWLRSRRNFCGVCRLHTGGIQIHKREMR
jgi:hypothetical protein